MKCPQCAHVEPEPFQRCPHCGHVAAASTSEPDATVLHSAPLSPPPSSRTGSLSTSGLGDARFAPGALLQERYRIVGRVGKGGMGEVYRAEDLTLGQEVALKFLPDAFSRDPQRRQRLLAEAKLARQVSHPNVCRVYDVGDFQGDFFLSMEFIEGRDLSSVLRSIGRLPEEKALDIARQLCAGLAALHDQGVLHRDLKPANVMLDERGRVRITDFGLAGIGEEIRGAEIRSGTPQYMAPEQLEGLEVTERSDIYALGLLLYEIFSGRPAVAGETLEEITQLQRSRVPSSLRQHITEIDPAIDRVVARCLEKDPARRPRSALLVSTALPGGDPLAAALAMGETPSPELVAACGGRGGIHPALGIFLLVVGLAGLLHQAGAFGPETLLHYYPMERSAEALEERARQLVEELGYDDRPADRFGAFARSGNMLQWMAERDSSAARWDALDAMSPTAVLYWYRQSPSYLLTEDPTARVSYADPPHVLTDMVRVTLDLDGRLVYFTAVPPESLRTAIPDSLEEADPAAVPEATWSRLFEAAGLTRASFREVSPRWVPDDFVTERRAWEGRIETAGDSVTVLVEAGGLEERPVYFRQHGPWSDGRRTVSAPRREGVAELFLVAIVFAVLIAAGVLARRNHRLSRSDTRGAGRLAVAILLLPTVDWLFRSHHVPLPTEMMNRFFFSLALGALYAVFCLVLYLALEPVVRRTWPEVLITWTRCLSEGGWKDPMVGRSMLYGAAFFGITELVDGLAPVVGRLTGAPPFYPESVNWYTLAMPRVAWADVAGQVPAALFNSLFFLMLLVVLRLILRRTWPAYLGFFLVTTLIIAVGSGDFVTVLPLAVIRALVMVFILVRLGMVTFFLGFLLINVTARIPLTLDMSQPYAETSVVSMLFFLAYLGVGLALALGGRSLLQDDLDRNRA